MDRSCFSTLEEYGDLSTQLFLDEMMMDRANHAQGGDSDSARPSRHICEDEKRRSSFDNPGCFLTDIVECLKYKNKFRTATSTDGITCSPSWESGLKIEL